MSFDSLFTLGAKAAFKQMPTITITRQLDDTEYKVICSEGRTGGDYELGGVGKDVELILTFYTEQLHDVIRLKELFVIEGMIYKVSYITKQKTLTDITFVRHGQR